MSTEEIIRDIAEERERQKQVEGFSPENDVFYYPQGQLAVAASCYAEHAGLQSLESGENNIARRPGGGPPRRWPFRREWWKPKGRKRNLVRAAALIVAELERLERLGIDDGD